MQVRRHVRQHRDAAADVEAADADRDARGAQRPRDVHGARELIGLHADQADQPAASARADLPDQLVGPDAGVGLVADGDPDLDLVTQHLALGAVEREAVERRERVRRDRRAHPLDDVAVVVVVGRLDQEEMEELSCRGLGTDHSGPRCLVRWSPAARRAFGAKRR